MSVGFVPRIVCVLYAAGSPMVRRNRTRRFATARNMPTTETAALEQTFGYSGAFLDSIFILSRSRLLPSASV